jgi:hypothetical protein
VSSCHGTSFGSRASSLASQRKHTIPFLCTLVAPTSISPSRTLRASRRLTTATSCGELSRSWHSMTWRTVCRLQTLRRLCRRCLTKQTIVTSLPLELLFPACGVLLSARLLPGCPCCLLPAYCVAAAARLLACHPIPPTPPRSICSRAGQSCAKLPRTKRAAPIPPLPFQPLHLLAANRLPLCLSCSTFPTLRRRRILLRLGLHKLWSLPLSRRTLMSSTS